MRVLLLCCAMMVSDQAPSKPDPKFISCWKILPYVWAYGEDAAIAWARSNGYSAQQILAMKKRCGKV